MADSQARAAFEAALAEWISLNCPTDREGPTGDFEMGFTAGRASMDGEVVATHDREESVEWNAGYRQCQSEEYGTLRKAERERDEAATSVCKLTTINKQLVKQANAAEKKVHEARAEVERLRDIRDSWIETCKALQTTDSADLIEQVDVLHARLADAEGLVEEAARWMDVQSSADGSGHADLSRSLRRRLNTDAAPVSDDKRD